MKNFKVAILGNSVGMRTRPHLADSKNYGQILEERLSEHLVNTYCQVNNRAFSRATILDILAQTQSLIAEFPNYYIINIGVCDAATREIPLWMSNMINNPKGGILKAVLGFIHHYLIKPNNAFFTRLRGKRAWVSPSRFTKLYSKLLHDVQQNTNARIICLGINLANQRVEGILPGSSQNYRDYSIIIKNCAAQAGVTYIDTHDLKDVDQYPDGTHFNDPGHQIIAQRILAVILHENS